MKIVLGDDGCEHVERWLGVGLGHGATDAHKAVTRHTAGAWTEYRPGTDHMNMFVKCER